MGKFFIAAFLFASFLPVFAGSLNLAERGKPATCEIVLSASASASERYAASELQSFLARQTGVTLPIRALPADAALPAHAIVLRTEKSGSPLGDEGFRLRVRGKRLFITGGVRRGVLFGVYELLERFGGCGWFTSWHEVVPELAAFSVPDNLDDTQCPAFELRETSWFDVCNHPAFALRNRNYMVRFTDEKFGGSPYVFDSVLSKCHTFARLLSPDELFDAHPEYFSEVEGLRRKHGTQLCLTNPEVVRLCTEKVLERVRESYPKGIRLYGVSQNDWRGFCTCANCKALDEAEGSPSGSLVQFVNRIAEVVARDYPDVFIETLVYMYTRKPPQTLRFHRNVIPCFCTIECDFAKPIPQSRATENIAVCETIMEWGARSAQMMLWDYVTDFFHYELTWPNVKTLAGNLRFFRESGVKVLYEQGNSWGPHGDWAELKAWLLMKLMWNPDQDEKALIDRYFAAMYGPAASEVRAYFEGVHAEPRDEATDPMGCYEQPERNTVSLAFLDRAAKLMDRAAEKVSAAGLEAYATNVACTRLSLDYSRAVKGCGRIRLRRDIRDVDPAVFRDVQAGARRVVAATRGPNPVVFAEENRFSTYCLEQFARAALPTSGVNRVFVDARACWRAGSSGTGFVQDPDAVNGFALHMRNTVPGYWTGYLHLGLFNFEPGAKVRVRLHVKVKRDPASTKGDAFHAGVWGDKVRKAIVPTISRKAADIPDGQYAWYDLGTWEPGVNEWVWIGPGRFPKGENRGSHAGVWCDGFELSLADDEREVEKQVVAPPVQRAENLL